MTLSVGDLVEFENKTWRLVSLEPPVALLREADAAISAPSTAVDLRTLMSAGRRQVPDADRDSVWPLFEPTTQGGFDAAAVLASLPPGYRKQVEDFAADIAELETGYRPDAETDDNGLAIAREGFDPAESSRSTRIDEMIRQKNAAGEEFPSKASLYRTMARYRKYGVAGLIDQRKHRPRFPLSHLDQRLVEVIFAVHEAEVTRTTGTRRRFIRRVKAEIESRYPDDATRPVVPPESTMYRILVTLLSGRRTFDDATSRRNNNPATGPTLFPKSVYRPGEMVQADSTTFDVQVADHETGRTYRPVLSTVVDLATRTLLAWDFTAAGPTGRSAPTSEDVALLFSDACTPLPLRPSVSGDITKALALAPLAKVVSKTDLEAAVREFPIIYPEAMNVDNGSIFVSERAHQHLNQLKVDITRSRKGRPTDKPNVERLYQSIHTMFAESLPGYVGYNVERRGRPTVKRTAESLLSIEELRAVFTVFVLTVYQRRPHSEITILGHATDTPLSPNDAFAAYSQWAGAIFAPVDTAAAIELLPKRFVSVQATGVRVNGSTFDHHVLEPYRGKPGPLSGKYAISFDPRNNDFAYFRDPATGSTHPLRNIKRAASTGPLFGELTSSNFGGSAPVGTTHTSLLNALDPVTNQTHAADLESWRNLTKLDHSLGREALDEQDPEFNRLDYSEDGPDPFLDPHNTEHMDQPGDELPPVTHIPDLEARP